MTVLCIAVRAILGCTWPAGSACSEDSTQKPGPLSPWEALPPSLRPKHEAFQVLDSNAELHPSLKRQVVRNFIFTGQPAPLNSIKKMSLSYLVNICPERTNLRELFQSGYQAPGVIKHNELLVSSYFRERQFVLYTVIIFPLLVWLLTRSYVSHVLL